MHRIFVLYMYYKYYINHRITITSMTKGLMLQIWVICCLTLKPMVPHNGPDGSMPVTGQKKLHVMINMMEKSFTIFPMIPILKI